MNLLIAFLIQYQNLIVKKKKKTTFKQFKNFFFKFDTKI